jgi:hypothetical protein
MKKAILMSAMIGLTSMCVNAQVVVDNNGNVTLGPTTTTKLTINETLNSAGLFIHSNGLN